MCFYNLIWGLHSAAQNGGLANGSWQVEPVDGATAGGLGVGQGRGGGEGGGVGNTLGGHSDCFLCLEFILMLQRAISTLLSFYLGIRCLDIHIRSYLALVG